MDVAPAIKVKRASGEDKRGRPRKLVGTTPALLRSVMQDIDIVIVGAGVAGLTAAMVAARHGVKVVVVDRTGVGGQISTAERIENFPGFPQGIAGHELGPLLHEQAEAAGAEFMLDTIEQIAPAGRPLPGARRRHAAGARRDRGGRLHAALARHPG